MADEKTSLPAVAEPYNVFDLCDDEQVLAEMQGRVLDTYVYHFWGSDGKKQTGLSKVGVDWACRELAKRKEVIRVRENTVHLMRCPINSEFVIAMIEAQRFGITDDGGEVPLDSAIGVKRQWTKMKKKNGDIIVDDFWAEKAISKATRNAKLSLIPQNIIKEVIAQYGKKNSQTVGSQPQQTQQRPQQRTQKPPTQRATKPPRQHPAEQKPPEKPQKTSAPPQRGKPKGDMAAIRQRFWVALKKVGRDEAQCREIYHDLTGNESIKDASEEVLTKITNLLQAVPSGENEVRQEWNGYKIVQKSDGAILYPEGQQSEQPPPQEAPPQEGATEEEPF
jgi:hypothetical protein